MSCRLWSMVCDSYQPPASNTNFFAYNDQAFEGSTTTLPLTIRETASVRQHHHSDSATVQLHRPRHARTSLGALTRDMQDYDFKARFECLPDSMNRLDTRGLLTRVWLLGSSCLAYPLSAMEEAYLKDTWSPQGPTCQLGVEFKKPFVNPNWLHI
jgi:hypothetical protein